MDIDRVLAEAAQWYKKLNNPASATFKIAHARRSEEVKSMFVPMRIFKQYEKAHRNI